MHDSFFTAGGGDEYHTSDCDFVEKLTKNTISDVTVSNSPTSTKDKKKESNALRRISSWSALQSYGHLIAANAVPRNLTKVSISNYIRAVRGALVNLIPFPWRANSPRVVLLAVNYNLSNQQSYDEFRLDFSSRVLFTYRMNFDAVTLSADEDKEIKEKFTNIHNNTDEFPSTMKVVLSPTNSTNQIKSSSNQIVSDSGWGCMLRVIQMTLVQCLIYQSMGRAWRRQKKPVGLQFMTSQKASIPHDLEFEENYTPVNLPGQYAENDEFCSENKKEYEKQTATVKNLITLFMDRYSSPFSLHNLVAEGTRIFGKSPSTWFGPTSAAMSISSLMERFPIESHLLCPLVFTGWEICSSSVIKCFEEDVSADKNECANDAHPLGTDRFNHAKYQVPLQECFSIPQFQGLAGGGPSSSAYYFVAANNDAVFYLDPHIKIQRAFTSARHAEEAFEQFFTDEPKQLSWKYLNPSMAIAFNRLEFDDLCLRLENINGSFFEILSESPDYVTHLHDFTLPNSNVDSDDPELVIL